MRARQSAQRGVTLLESLVVLTILAISAAALVPMAAERIRLARVRTSVNQFSIDLRAARWAAVSGRKAVEMTILANPDNSYEYVDSLGRARQVQLPEGVRIVSTTNPIQFLSNGSVVGGSQTIIETDLNDGVVSKWTIRTNVLGVPSMTMKQVES